MKCSVGKVASFRILQLVVRAYKNEILRKNHLLKEESFTTELATNFASETVLCTICFRQNYVVLEPLL